MRSPHGSPASIPIPQRSKTAYISLIGTTRRTRWRRPGQHWREIMATTRPSTMRRMYNAFVDARFRSVEREIARVRIYHLEDSARSKLEG
tara:strand:- start:739 stop:1008 length:270 start_codon:yes stop_codon:yes gene_type:complete